MRDHLQAPLTFTPVYQTLVWGGNRIKQLRGDEVPDGPIGEAWDIADQDRGMSVVASGPLQGTTLRDIVQQEPEALIGTCHDGGDFPLLIKLIDANDRLSVQVHPDDELAQELGVGNRGKTECWYLMGEGGELYQGTAPGVDRDEFARAIQEDRVAETINSFQTHDGDFFFMPARTVHALGTGCLLFEIQQSCDVTFRVYDWGRVGLDGKPRQLHIDESLQTIDFSEGDFGPTATETVTLPDGGTQRDLVTCPYFSVSQRTGTSISGGSDDGEHCTIVICLAGEGNLGTNGGSVPLIPNRTFLVPAAAGDWQATATTGELQLLIAHPR